MGAARSDRYIRSAIVARHPTVVAVAKTFRYLLPSIPLSVFGTREEALRFLVAPVPNATQPSLAERVAMRSDTQTSPPALARHPLSLRRLRFPREA
jgi:hypothetical protein